jgi:hypothetical protein
MPGRDEGAEELQRTGQVARVAADGDRHIRVAWIERAGSGSPGVLVSASPGSGAGSVATLDAAALAKLLRLVFIEGGHGVERTQARADHVDLHLVVSPLGRRQRARVRVLDRQAERRDVEDVGEVRAAEALADAVLICPAGGDVPPSDDRVRVVDAAELEGMLRASALIAWEDGIPHAVAERYATLAETQATASAHDPIGLRWLTTLALNRVPPELAGTGQSADRLLERIVFRLLTTVFRFGGQRLGEAWRGERVPDAVLTEPGCPSEWAVFLDCKAAGDGYTMISSEERAQVEYVRDRRDLAEADGHRLTHTVIVSSDFAGDFDRRAAALAKHEVKLCYLRAGDLVRLALAIETAEEPPAVREAFPWTRVFDLGRPEWADLEQALEDARAAARSENTA